jgi:hypothetical protein
MDGEQGIAAVVGSLEHGLQLEATEVVAGACDFLVEFDRERPVGLSGEQFDQAGRVVESIDQLLIRGDPALKRPDFGDLLPGARRVRPECGFGLACLEVLEPRYLAIQVKESLVVRRRAA